MSELKITVKNGCIKVNKYREYRFMAEDIANEVCNTVKGEYERDFWVFVFKSVLENMGKHAKFFKAKILTQISYPLHLHGKTSERIGLPFKEAKAYVNGYNDATKQFNDLFDEVEDAIADKLDEVMPSEEWLRAVKN